MDDLRRWVLLALALASGCGGDSGDGEVTRPPAKAWGLPGGVPVPGLAEEVRGSSDCVLVLVLDGVSQAELDRDDLALPNLESLAAGAVRYEDAITVSTGGNSGLASLLTGRYPPEHGVGSMRTPMFARLADDERTLAEGFHDLGWRTVASLAEARLSREVSGFGQGFDGFDAPRPGGAARDALGVSIGARDLLAGPLLEPGLGVFGLVVFGAPLEAGKVDPEKLMAAAPLIGERLASVAADRADVALELQRMDGTAEATDAARNAPGGPASTEGLLAGAVAAAAAKLEGGGGNGGGNRNMRTGGGGGGGAGAGAGLAGQVNVE